MRRILLAVAIAGAFVILMGLGTWQLQRLAWKEALIAAAHERPGAAAVPAPGPDTWSGFAIDDWRYRRVTLTGTFGPREAYFWIALTEPNGPLSGAGAMVLAPFRTTDGWTVLVNRGFVPEDRRDPASRPGSEPPEGTVTVEGLVRRDDPPSFITPAPDAASRTFYARDIAAIAGALDAAPPVAPYQIDLVAEETPPGGLPQAGESRMTFTNNHLGYAFTWFGLGAALLGVTAAALWRRSGRRHGPHAAPSSE
ncbi:SURF1 family protein [Acuticoccus sediminis]|uniref:SURF1 family protein n=1 Tax=Acuticoccus sediminis TaxID=2184697 RepID=UPI001CFD02CA|nr:SURF1 family protein [Acuticoccus sediminis]